MNPAFADSADAPVVSGPTTVAQSATTTSTVTGNVRDQTGAAVNGARVTLSGPTSVVGQTDSQGNFSITAPPGIYRVSIGKPGYNPVSLSDVTIAPGTSTPLAVTMSQADLNSLRTIGTVTSTTRGNQINAGPAVSSYLSGAAIANYGAPQINDVIQHLPGVTVQQMGSQQDRSIVVGGVQPYETQVLIDGHPLALGQYGVWVSTYFPSWLVGGIETQIGPGNTTPFANIAVGGTANIVTPGFTSKPQIAVTQSYDNYQSQVTTLLASGTLGRLGYVIDLGTSGLNTPFTGTTKCILLQDSNNPGYATTSTCTNADGNLFQFGSLYKLRYNFSDTTSFEAGFVGAWAGYRQQGTAWGTFLGQNTIEQCQVAGGVCSNPNLSYLNGRTITGYQWYTGSDIYNNQTLFDGQFRTAIGSTTVLVRPYLGAISPENNVDRGNANNVDYYGPTTGLAGSGGLVAGQPVPPGYVGPAGSVFASCQGGYTNLTNAAGVVTVTPSNQFECYHQAYSTYEQDKLYGMTTSVIQPFGNDNSVTLGYDFHGQSTTATVDGGVSVPTGTADRYSTFELLGDVHLTPSLTANLGLYTTQWTYDGFAPTLSQPDLITGFITAAESGTALSYAPPIAANSRSVTRGDPHIALVERIDPNTSIRASYGDSTTFPFLGQVSGNPVYEPPACSLGPPFENGGTLILKNPSLGPETSVGFGLGADHRFGNGSVLSVDLASTVVHDVFEQLTTVVPTNLPQTCGPGSELGVFQPVNVAQLKAQSVILKYNYSPRKGFGFNIAATAESSILNGLSAFSFTPGAGSVPANNVQICGNGVAAPGIATCIPYLSGYGQITYALPDGTFMGLGANYQGKNNAYFQPPFAIVDFVARRPVSKTAELQLSVQNLLNTNNYGAYLPIPGAGTPLVADTTNASFSQVQQTSYTPTLVTAPPRYVTLQVRLHVGGP